MEIEQAVGKAVEFAVNNKESIENANKIAFEYLCLVPTFIGTALTTLYLALRKMENTGGPEGVNIKPSKKNHSQSQILRY